MNDNLQLSATQITRGFYKKICFEIQHPHDFYKFTYYIYLPIDKLKDRELAERLWIKAEPFGLEKMACNYLDNEFLRSLNFHCGITFYRKLYADNDTRIIEIGCDYNHYWDKEQGYNLNDVLSDVKSTIDDLYSKTEFEEN